MTVAHARGCHVEYAVCSRAAEYQQQAVGNYEECRSTAGEGTAPDAVDQLDRKHGNNQRKADKHHPVAELDRSRWLQLVCHLLDQRVRAPAGSGVHFSWHLN